MNIEVYSDGSATIPTKPGGYGWLILIDGTKVLEGSGFAENVSNNDMEMEGAVQGLANCLKLITGGSIKVNIESTTVTLKSDSQLILGWVTGKYRFKQSLKLEKFRQLKHLADRLNVKTEWVQGHAGHEHNERCDKLANEARLSLVKTIAKVDARTEGTTFIGDRKKGVVAIWYGEKLKIVDFNNNVVEDYDKAIHGSRGSFLEIRKELSR